MDTLSQIINQPSVVNDIELTATLPHEMVESQKQLLDWCENKVIAIKSESKELLEATEHAKKMKWKSATLQSQYNKSLKRIQYYEKIYDSLCHGYYIVPNFPIQMFAIRTKKLLPEKGYRTSYWSNTHEQFEQELPSQEGVYKNPYPLVRTKTYKDSEGKEIVQSYADNWDDFEFPITMAKPFIMEATSRALALKIFDRIGIMPAERKTDPVIIGQIINKNSYNTKIVSFMIAWHLNTNVL